LSVILTTHKLYVLSNETDFVLGFIPFYLERLNGIFLL